MSRERALAQLQREGWGDRVRFLDTNTATVELAAQALGCAPERIAKTLALSTPEGPLLVIAAGDVKLSNAKFRAQFGCKAQMMPGGDVEVEVGHAPGGVCSFALPENVKTYLDVSLKRFETVFPAAGSSNSAIEMTCEELERYSSNFSGWVDVCKPKEG